jgi:valyl-tRNA synthetase
LDNALRLLHPVVPFITEELWQKLPGREPRDLLATASWPVLDPTLVNENAERVFGTGKAYVTLARALRAENNVARDRKPAFYINPGSMEARASLVATLSVIGPMSGSDAISFEQPPNVPGAHGVLPDGTTVFMPLDGVTDLEAQCRRLSAERERLDNQLAGLAAKLSNENFVARAPAEVVARERDKEREWRLKRDVLDEKLKSLGCS